MVVNRKSHLPFTIRAKEVLPAPQECDYIFDMMIVLFLVDVRRAVCLWNANL